MTANYEKEQRELLKLVADGKKKLQDAGQTKVDLRLLMKALRDYTDIRQLTHCRWAILCPYGKRDAVSNGGDPSKPAAVQIFCIKQNTVQPLFRDCTVFCIKTSLTAHV